VLIFHVNNFIGRVILFIQNGDEMNNPQPINLFSAEYDYYLYGYENLKILHRNSTTIFLSDEIIRCQLAYFKWNTLYRVVQF